jgi:glycosyltransferase involved in cell wall biosynthesis
MSRVPVSVVVPVKNEEKNIVSCLKALQRFSEIFVLDSSSTDRTIELALQYNAKIIDFNWNGQFPKKRNWFLKNVEISNDWVLFIDADEIVTNDFIDEIVDAIKSNAFNGYWLSYRNEFMGRILKYGDKMKKLALVKKGFGQYEEILENSWTSLDMEVHEHIIIDGKVGKIKSSILHKDFNGLDRYISKHNEYSRWEVQRYLNKPNNYNQLLFRQKVKYSLFKSGLLPVLYFIYSYFIKLGFLDFREGFNFAVYKSYYFFQINTKLKEAEKMLHKNDRV